jgi:hypothetical protein
MDALGLHESRHTAILRSPRQKLVSVSIMKSISCAPNAG